MALQEEETQLQNPAISLLLDGLYCEEEPVDEDLGGYGYEEESGNVKEPLVLSERDLFWEDDELVSLISKEIHTHLGQRGLEFNGSIIVARREAVGWMLRVNAHYGFTAMTVVLAVNYFDRFVSSFCFQRDKPWMSQLAAVACLSLAAKVEETQVPLLLDLQVEDSKYVFEAKTIQRMELLVLSTLQWKMNPVTPLSFFDHIIRRLALKSHLQLEFLWRCERLLLSVINDSRFVCYLPSELATASMIHVIKEIEPCNALDYQNQFMAFLKTSKEKVDDCYKLILELLGDPGCKHYQTHKRKHQSIPGSPNGVFDAYFSSDSSNDSWGLALSVSSSPEPLFKKSRAQDQQMRLAPLKRASVRVFGSPR
ncbi:cyclin-D3-2-like [Cornus florida]|uniref:cyclin-D3-2-like n=1 Tax=Cornus florida TaxID=4283 RepID=UPI00289D3974|nr:cyclin-D3-2-like [Cornus florida]